MNSKYKTYQLKNFVTQIRGVSYEKSQVSDLHKEGLIPLLKANNIQDGKLNFDNTIFVKKELVNENQLMKKGDILIAASSGSKKIVGKAGQVLSDNTGVAFGAFCKLIRVKQSLNDKYLYYFFNTDYYKHTIYNSINGANINNLKNEHIDNLMIPAPDKDMQERIVEILDKVQSLIDKRRQQMKALDELARSIFLDMFGDPYLNPNQWKLAKLEELGNWMSGGTPARKVKEYYTGNIPWISSGELNNLYTCNSNESITKQAIKETAAKIIPVGSLLLGMYDTAALKSTITIKNETSCNQAIAFAMLDKQKVNTLYCYYCIQTSKEHYKRQQRGIRQKNLNLTMIKNIEILLPPLDLQMAFEEKIKSVLEQKNKATQSLNKLQNLFNSLMQRAFSGELFKELEKVQ